MDVIEVIEVLEKPGCQICRDESHRFAKLLREYRLLLPEKSCILLSFHQKQKVNGLSSNLEE